MKGPLFSARVVAANKRSDEVLARVIATMQSNPDNTGIDVKVVKRVLRPMLHVFNECFEENTKPAEVLAAISMLTASMVVEMCNRIVPKGVDPKVLCQFAEDQITDIADNICEAFNAHYGDMFDMGDPTPPAGTVIQ